MTQKRKQHASQGDNASTAEAAPGRVGRGEQGEARRASSTPNGGPDLELGRLRLKTWSKTDFSISQTTGQNFRTCADTWYVLNININNKLLNAGSLSKIRVSRPRALQPHLVSWAEGVPDTTRGTLGLMPRRVLAVAR